MHHNFLKKFRENNFFSREFTIWLISRNNFQVIQKFSKLYNVRGLWKLEKFTTYSRRKKDSSNQPFSNFICINVTFTKFFQNGRNFHTVTYLCHSVEKREIHCHANIFSSNQFSSLVKSYFHEIFAKKWWMAVKFRNFHTVSVEKWIYSVRKKIVKSTIWFFVNKTISFTTFLPKKEWE